MAHEDVELMGLQDESLYCLVEVESGKVMGWAASPEPLYADGEYLAEQSGVSLVLRDAQGQLVASFG